MIRAVIFCIPFCTPFVAQASGFADQFRESLYAGRLDEAAATAADAAESAGDDTARFALGTARFLGAVEGLMQSLHRHGLNSRYENMAGLAGLPFLRLPVPANPSPDPVSYEAVRGILAEFGTALGRAEDALADAGARPIDLQLDLWRIRLDIDGDGTAGDDESIFGILLGLVGGAPDTPDAPLLVDFDAADAAWLRAYSHLLMAMADLPLAYDWRAAYDATFHAVFPESFTPKSMLPQRSEDLRRKLAEIEVELGPPPSCDFSQEGCQESWEAYHQSDLYQERMDAEFAVFGSQVMDFIAFVHLMRLPLAEPDRIESAFAHLEGMVAGSRETWRRILDEDDDRNEWVPGPEQSGALPTLTIDQARLDGWMAFLDEFEAIVTGKKLLPHWRFERGFNLRRVLMESQPLDLVMLVQGSAVVPFLEEGPMTDAETWEQIIGVFGNDFLAYAIWLN